MNGRRLAIAEAIVLPAIGGHAPVTLSQGARSIYSMPDYSYLQLHDAVSP